MFCLMFRWLSWARCNQHLKVISADVPQLILPSDYQGVLHDVKVFVKHGPDDSVYDNNKDIRDRVCTIESPKFQTWLLIKMFTLVLVSSDWWKYNISASRA